MIENKVCPLLSDTKTEAVCIRKRCAWWVHGYSCCAILPEQAQVESSLLETARQMDEVGGIVNWLKLQAKERDHRGWNGRCTLCGGWGPFRKPKDPQYEYTEICAWCSAEVPLKDRADHPKAPDGGPKEKVK